MDRKERIAQLEEELRTRGAEFMVDGGFDDEMRESFLKHVLDCENAEHRPLREWLSASAYTPAANPCDVSAELKRFLDHLAFLGITVELADHLSDAELYACLHERLDDPVALLEGTVLHLEMLAFGDEDDDRTWLTYYASDEDRAEWRRRFPHEELPEKQTPKYQRQMPDPFRGERGEA